ncbi:heme o synthase [Candidatus Palibaumannia cicadellinicola]|uniref:Protoheme IX farnesyltransferase n=1 Tax=Baumannia cicadellinicola subsp. Homalodisca coagulata TaxID=374463 RepID=CYOE_BAUCH|nr:heme o synthase [Candidatus Baumannia cicadellinicola]Q1LTJ4.1 RecName: Full=Protoheme IX farnesyltransferase; AltName: Full=Heme B farnesyltransferase; AltName: Full=Heme O synthase [Baumannia cicadellinicola str. Hc (Homalodisca coagulata)]ABF13813.1 protoheme IX farnesyltransferase [Baumannia cicadellinicola str. Hc (Homalodisca coagulata)]MBS0032714.1 heme o synthase [Candidatus Baumannia cicadellinicola]MCJ7462296.1 heme o synthase [Candidatus Baumannia cicadellinicola]MCJ7462816.1 hem
MIRLYLQATKPGIVLSNLMSFIGGFLLASKGRINYLIFLVTLLGVLFIVTAGCVLNNIIDRDIDRKMERTKNRPLAIGSISILTCLIYALICSIIGIYLLYNYTNKLTMLLAIIGLIVYVGIYTKCMKRQSIYSTIIGSFSGAIPPVIGYCAVSNQFDTGALLLLLIFCLWQMPHSYAIAILRLQDYQAASIPILPIKKGIRITKNHIVIYIVAFIVTTILLNISGYTTSYQYLIVTNFINFWWLYLALQGYKEDNNDILWSKKMFIFSIIAITSLSLMMSLDSIFSR